MKMTGVEKGVLTTIVLLVVMMIGTVFFGLKSCNDAGGIKQMAIDVGKEWKEISKEVSDYNPEK